MRQFYLEHSSLNLHTMKIHRLTLSAASFCALLAACSELPEITVPTDENSTPLEISVKASDGIQTRGIITGSSLESGSRIGLSLYDSGESTYGGISYENITYTASGSGSAQRWETESPIMVSSTPGTLYGYYPYSEDVTDISEITITADSDNQTDYLYATPVNNITKANSNVALMMNHALAAIRLSISRGTYTGTGELTSVSLSSPGIPTSALLDARTGKLSSFDGYSEAVAPDISGHTLSRNASIVDILTIPTGDTPKTLSITLTIDGKEFNAVIDDVVLKQGTMNECMITVDNAQVVVTGVSLTAWQQTSAGSHITRNDYKVTLAGDYQGISFSNEVDEDGVVTILAVPYVSDGAEVKPVTITGDATLEQSVDDRTGIRTIILSDIASDVQVTFNSYYLFMTAIHEITNISSTTKIYGSSYGDRYLDMMKIDGQEVAIQQYHQFETTGTHVVKYSFKDRGKVNDGMFGSAKTIKQVILPEGFTHIGNIAFQGNSSIESINFPESLIQLGYQAFQRCTSLSCPFVLSDKLKYSYGIFSGCSKLTEVTLAPNTTSIPSSMFEECTSLKQIDIPDGVTTIGSSAFAGSAIETLHIPDGITVLDQMVLKNCTSLKELRLPSGLKQVKDQAFYSCSALERVILGDGTVCTDEFIIPEGVTTIGEMSFNFQSPNIKAIRIPSTLINVPAKGFVSAILERYTMSNPNPKYDIRNHSVIETATNTLVGVATQGTKIHESVTAIGDYAYYFSRIETVDFPEGLTNIGQYAFDSSYPKVIISRALTPPSLGTYAFRVSQYYGTLKVPSEALADYRSQWMVNQVGYLGWSTAGWSIRALVEGE